MLIYKHPQAILDMLTLLMLKFKRLEAIINTGGYICQTSNLPHFLTFVDHLSTTRPCGYRKWKHQQVKRYP